MSKCISSSCKLGTRKKRFDSFKMKTRIFDFITDPSIQTIAYVDCDIIFGIEGIVNTFYVDVFFLHDPI